jgi:hypothetical protein
MMARASGEQEQPGMVSTARPPENRVRSANVDPPSPVTGTGWPSPCPRTSQLRTRHSAHDNRHGLPLVKRTLTTSGANRRCIGRSDIISRWGQGGAMQVIHVYQDDRSASEWSDGRPGNDGSSAPGTFRHWLTLTLANVRALSSGQSAINSFLADDCTRRHGRLNEDDRTSDSLWRHR